jgi:hypothetical protein
MVDDTRIAPKGTERFFSDFFNYTIRSEKTDITTKSHPEGLKSGNNPLASVAVGITHDGVYCRGITIYSPTEPKGFDKTKGRNKAYGRMIEACRRKGCDDYVSHWLDDSSSEIKKSVESFFNRLIELQIVDITLDKNNGKHCKSLYNVMPSEYEVSRFQKLRENAEKA